MIGSFFVRASAATTKFCLIAVRMVEWLGIRCHPLQQAKLIVDYSLLFSSLPCSFSLFSALFASLSRPTWFFCERRAEAIRTTVTSWHDRCTQGAKALLACHGPRRAKKSPSLYLSSPGQRPPREPRTGYGDSAFPFPRRENAGCPRFKSDGLALVACAPARVQMGIFFFTHPNKSTFEAQAQASIPFFPNIHTVRYSWSREPKREFRGTEFHLCTMARPLLRYSFL